jgi:iron(III) transport system permease protein
MNTDTAVIDPDIATPQHVPDSTRPVASPRRFSSLPARLGWLLVALALVFLMLVPMVSVQMRAMDDGGSYAELLRSSSLLSTLWSTAVLGLGSVAIALVLGTGLAWCAMQLPPSLNWLSMAPMLPVMTPGLAVVTGWAFLLAPETGYINQALRKLPWWQDLPNGPINVYSEFWIVLITGTLLVSFVYLFVLTAMRSMDSTLIEAARTSGASQLRTWFRVVLPMLRPSLFYSAAIVLLLGLGQFTAPLLLGRDANVKVLTTEMYAGVHSYPIDYGIAAAYGSPLVIVGVILLFVQRRGLAASHRFENVGTRGHRTGLRKQPWLSLPIISYVVVVVVLPLAALVNVALAPYYSGQIISPSAASLDNFRTVLAEPDARASVGNSVTYSILAMLVVVPFSYVIAVTLTTRARSLPRMVRVAVDLLASMPLVMPGVLFGAGILFAYSEGPIVLYGTSAALVLVYVTIMIPHVTRILQAGLIGSGNSLADAARVHGASALRTHLRILVPLLRPALAAGAAITFSILTHEFSASSMVRSTNTEVMGTLLYKYWTLGSYPKVAVMALLMCVITAVLVVLAYAAGFRRKASR